RRCTVCSGSSRRDQPAAIRPAGRGIQGPHALGARQSPELDRERPPGRGTGGGDREAAAVPSRRRGVSGPDQGGQVTANPLPAREIFDVTIRDGSYVVDFQFDQRDVAGLYTLIDRMGFRYIEVGHGFGLNASAVKGSAAASDDEYLAAAAAGCTTSKFGTF